MLDTAALLGTEKTASFFQNMGKGFSGVSPEASKMGYGFASNVLGEVAAAPIGNFIKHKMEHGMNAANYRKAYGSLQNNASQTFQGVLEEDPELAHPQNIEKTKKYFGILTQFAPVLATNPVVAASFIRKTMAYGGVDEKAIADMVKTNNDAMKHYSSM